MTKEDLRGASYQLTQWPNAIHWFASSGTTGQPTLYPWTTADEEIALRALVRIHSATESAPGSTALIIAPLGLASMWSHMDRQLRYLNYATVFPGVESPKRIISLFPTLRPRLLMSLPLGLTRLGELWKFSGADKSWHPDVLFVGGDVLSNARRKRLEALWQAQVCNFYGLSEIFGPLARDGEGEGIFDWLTPEVGVEVLNPVTRAAVMEGETGVAVYTTRWERPAQLTRYWSGDLFQLLGWLAPGQPRFRVRGRQQVSLPGLCCGVHPVDVDETLLTDPAIGNEWSIEIREEHVVILYESPLPLDAVDAHTLRRVGAHFEAPVRLEPVQPGALDRSRPKLGLAQPGYN